MPRALITGASSGLGRDFARIFSEMGYELYIVARRTERLENLKEELNTPVEIITADLSDRRICLELFDKIKDIRFDVLINNAGFGLCGRFDMLPLEKELELIDTNITALHILTKLFLPGFKSHGGYILNVGSAASFAPGPLMSAYYASKSYVLRFTQSLYREFKKHHLPVNISVLCPGPVKTEFDDIANVRFSLNGMDSMQVARYAVKQMFKHKCVIVPGFKYKMAAFAAKLLPDSLLSCVTYNVQRNKTGDSFK